MNNEPDSQVNIHTSHSLFKLVSAFISGIVFLGIILYIALSKPNPTEFQIFVFRVVLALAGAAFAVVIPGFLSTKFQMASNYVKAGGAIAVFVVIFFFNPPAILTGFTPFGEAIADGDAALANNNLVSAKDYYLKASSAKPKNWKPFYKLGVVTFKQGNFSSALYSFKKASKFKEEEKIKKDGRISYALAMTNDALNQYEQAMNAYKDANMYLTQNSGLWKETKYDLGLIGLKIWLENDSPKKSKLFDEAYENLLWFIENNDDIPDQWAYYGLACLEATRAKNNSLPLKSISQIQAKAQNYLIKAKNGIAESKSSKAVYQQQLIDKLLKTHDSYVSRPGEPVYCPALVELEKAA